MDVWDLLRIAKKRWWVTLPLLSTLLFMSYLMSSRVGAEYQATASTLLLPPNVVVTRNPITDQEEITRDNPFLGGSETDNLNRAMAIAVGSDEVRREFLASGLAATYTLTPDNRASILAISVVGQTPEQAAGTLDEVLLRLDDELTARQDTVQADARDRASYQLLGRTSVVPDYGAQRRVLGVFGVVSAVVTMVVVASVDGLARRRDRRRASTAAEVGVDERAAAGPPMAEGHVGGGTVELVATNGYAHHPTDEPANTRAVAVSRNQDGSEPADKAVEKRAGRRRRAGKTPVQVIPSVDDVDWAEIASRHAAGSGASKNGAGVNGGAAGIHHDPRAAGSPS